MLLEESDDNNEVCSSYDQGIDEAAFVSPYLSVTEGSAETGLEEPVTSVAAAKQCNSTEANISDANVLRVSFRSDGRSILCSFKNHVMQFPVYDLLSICSLYFRDLKSRKNKV